VKPRVRKRITKGTQVKIQNKIILIGDSHIRGLTSELKNHLGREYSISSTLMPGAGLQNITNLSKNEVTTLTKSDTVIVCGGSNDVNRNESQAGLNSLENFVNLRTNSKVLILPLPHRHDLTYDSCVNKEIQSFNRKLHKVMKNKEMAKILNYDITREGFTRHGQHLNSAGKSKLAHHIVHHLTRTSITNDTEPIPMKWNTTSSDLTPSGTEATGLNKEISDLNSEEKKENQPITHNQSTRSLNRRKKSPPARSQDFLWD
jgi:hypothetical protein